MASVQFYGIENAVEAYINNNCPAWGLFSGRQLLFKYTGDNLTEGSALLTELCEKIESSNATYTLKVFEPEANKKLIIKENTPCDSSFNFKLIAEDIFRERNDLRSGNNLQSRLAAIEAKIEESEEGEEDNGNIIGRIVKNIINEPEKVPVYIGAIQSILSLIMGNNKQQPAASLGAIPGESDLQINQAIDILKRNDPKIGEHLLKLAAISESDKATWTMLIGMIDKM